MGITQSMSTPSFSANACLIQPIPNSQSLDTGVSNLQHSRISSLNSAENGINGTYTDWKGKVGKDPKMPALLAAVELPQCRTAKVCISPDFTKFVTVDIYGSVSTFKPF